MFSHPSNHSSNDPVQSLLEQAAGTVFPGAVVWALGPDSKSRCWVVGRLDHRPDAPNMVRQARFDLASLTKPMATASLCMVSTANGELSVSDPLAKHLPEFLDGPQPERRAQVTLGHLLTHSAGLPAWHPYYEMVPQAADAADASATVVQLICSEPLTHAPGQQSTYSDLGYILLGEVLQRVTGTPLEQLFNERVADPLGLSHCRFNLGNHPGTLTGPIAATLDCPRRGRLLSGVVHDDNAFAMGGVAGHAGLFANADAVGTWGQALLAAYHGDDRWLPPKIVQSFLDCPPMAAKSSWVMGFDTPTPPSSAGAGFGPTTVGHLGYTGTSVWIDRQARQVVVLLTNRICPRDGDLTPIRRFRPALHDAVVASY